VTPRASRPLPDARMAPSASARTRPGSGARYHLWRPDWLRTGTGFGGGVRSTNQVPGFHLPLALDRDRSPRLAHELVLEQLLRRPGDLDPPRGPLGLHAARGVHSVAPEVVQEPLAADHAGHDRS